jgi:ATP-binding cassette subfamily B protein
MFYFITREGISMLGISDGAESIGLRTISVKVTYESYRGGFSKIVWKD